MKSPHGAWSNTEQAKPASQYDIRYGHGLLRAETSTWPRYIVVSTPSALRAAEPHMSRKPAGVEYVGLLDWGQLQEITDSLTSDADLVVGLGGGRALDAAKYVALSKQLPIILVPTTISTGAIIHGIFGKWEGRNLIYEQDGWPWIDCERVLVDYDVVSQAPYYLNTAGLGDILCGYAGLAEWKRNSKLGIGPPVDDDIVAPVERFHTDITQEFPTTLDEQGGLTAESIRYIMTAVQARDDRSLRHPAAPGADHHFVGAVELVNDKGWVHGEIVALAGIVVAWQCDESPETLISRLDRCRIRRRPSEMGVGREELRKGLEFMPSYMSDKASGRDFDSIMRREPVVGARFDMLWDFLETA